MNKKKKKAILIVLLGCVTATDVLAYDFKADNGYGVTIYYNKRNSQELEVTYEGKEYYTNTVVIPSVVNSGGVSYRVTAIGKQAFKNCQELTSVIIPPDVKIIDEEAFDKCGKLSTVTMSDGIEHIYYAAFRDCYSLSSITIPESVKYIDNQAFRYCTRLTLVTIPEGVRRLGDRAFENCVELISVTIPNSIVEIGDKVFDDDTKLVNVISLMENPLEIPSKLSATSVFTWETFTNGTLYVPVGTIEKYKATKGWQDFMHIEEGNPSAVSFPKVYSVQISHASGLITFKGLTDGMMVKVFGVDGKLYGTKIVNSNQTTIETNLREGDLVIVKIDNEYVKFVLK